VVDLQHFMITGTNCYAVQMTFERNKKCWLKLNIFKIFTLEEAALAHELMESRQTTGKLLIAINK